MSLRLDWTPRALKDLGKLDRSIRARVSASLQRYAQSGVGDIVQLRGVDPPEYRLQGRCLADSISPRPNTGRARHPSHPAARQGLLTARLTNDESTLGDHRPQRSSPSSEPAWPCCGLRTADEVHPTYRTFRAEAMATTFVVELPDQPGAAEAAEEVFAIFRRIDAEMSEWKPTSPLSAVNRQAGGAAAPVPAELRALLHRGVEIGELTGGAFDVTWAALWGLWDFKAAEPRVPEAAEIARRVALIDYRQVEIDDAAGTVRLPRAGMKIGLGGIAKGYALERAAAVLDARGVGSYLLLAGGQVFARGRKGDRPWRVGIRDPRGGPDDSFASLDLTDASASTSGDYESYFMLDGVRYHHILDPRTGMPARGLESATVIAADPTLADALSTALMVLGPRARAGSGGADTGGGGGAGGRERAGDHDRGRRRAADDPAPARRLAVRLVPCSGPALRLPGGGLVRERFQLERIRQRVELRVLVEEDGAEPASVGADQGVGEREPMPGLECGRGQHQALIHVPDDLATRFLEQGQAPVRLVVAGLLAGDVVDFEQGEPGEEGAAAPEHLFDAIGSRLVLDQGEDGGAVEQDGLRSHGAGPDFAP